MEITHMRAWDDCYFTLIVSYGFKLSWYYVRLQKQIEIQRNCCCFVGSFQYETKLSRNWEKNQKAEHLIIVLIELAHSSLELISTVDQK